MLDGSQCYAALSARDARFDGVFFVGVSTTGVYCRPVCRVRRPRRDRCSFFDHAAQAEAAGYRPCLRCRPELAPGRAAVDSVRRVAQLAAARIEAGALESGGFEGLAGELGLSARQLRRAIDREFGVSPGQLERTRQLLLAKQLLTDTGLKVVDVAFASGFSSVRQFNRVFRQRYRMTPGALRRGTGGDDARVVLRLGYRPPLAWDAMTRFLVSRGAPTVEWLDGRRYCRRVWMGGHAGEIAAEPDARDGLLAVEVSTELLPVLPQLSTGLRRLFDLDADPGVIGAHLGHDAALSARVVAVPGLRVPGTLDGFELALRAVLGQQISVKAATTLFARLIDRFGAPDATKLAAQSVRTLGSIGLPRRRAETLRALSRAVVDGAVVLEPTPDPAGARRALLQVPGIGPWTADYVAMRALRDPDAFPHGDLGLLRGLGIERAAELDRRAEPLRPFRAYAAMYLWST